MKLIHFCFFLFYFFVADATLSPSKIPDTITQSKRAIWNFENKRDPRKGGTAFAVSPKLVVTSLTNFDLASLTNLNKSLLQGDPTQNIILSQDDTSSKIHINRIVAVSALYNLILMETRESVDSYFHLEDKAPLDNENIFISAYLSQGFKNIQNTGPLFYRDSQLFSFPVNEFLPYGASGSPVLNKKGELVGVSSIFNIHIINVTPLNILKAFIKGELGSICDKFPSVKACIGEDIKHLKKLAEQGDAFAQNELARMYVAGIGVPKDKSKAFLLTKNSTEQGHIPAKADLSAYYDRGIGVERNFKKAFDLRQELAKKGNPLAQLMLGAMYKEGLGVEQDFEKAFYWYQQSEKRGYLPALSEQAEMLARGKGVAKDPVKALKMLEQAASMGCTPALDYLGDMYREGLGVEKDLKKAADLYKQAYLQGNTISLSKYADLYKDILGVENFLKNIDLHRQTEQSEYVPTLTELAVMYEEAAEFNHASAQVSLGDMYAEGLGVKQDLRKAIELYRKAAEQGNERAQSQLEYYQNRSCENSFLQ